MPFGKCETLDLIATFEFDVLILFRPSSSFELHIHTIWCLLLSSVLMFCLVL